MRKRLSFFLAILVSSLIIFPISITYANYADDLTSKEKIMDKNNTGVVLLDKDGNPFFTFYEAKNKKFVPLSQIPKSTQKALIAAEDKDFYSHDGFSFKAILRSAYENIKSNEFAYGGSTITQQLVKNALLTSEKSLARKYQEVLLAEQIEKRYSKDEILEMYLNSVYFGEGAFGVEEAAQVYFGKSAKDLTIAESALLIGLLPAPSQLSPFSGDKASAFKRKEIVLRKMLDQTFITREEFNKATAQKISFNTTPTNMNQLAPHFALEVKNELIKKYGEEYISRAGLTVKTTLDSNWQQYAENVVAQQVEKLASNNVTNGAAVVIDPTSGAVRVMVGSKDWYDTKFGKVNMALSPRSPGSSFKPIVYAAALDKHTITPATVLRDQKTTYKGGYSPVNYDRSFRGKVTVRRALSNSLNVPAVEVISKLGVDTALIYAKNLGISTLGSSSDYGPSLVLGSGEIPLLEMTNAYATFANSGKMNKPIYITSVKDKYGKDIYTYTGQSHQVVSRDVAFLISSILSDQKARAEEFGTALNISRPAAVKTGTAEDYRDALTIGYTPSLTVGVWVGNNDNSSMDSVAGSLGAAPIWKNLMETYLADTPLEVFTPTENVVALAPCTKSASASASMEYFIKGTETSSCYRVPQRSIAVNTAPTKIQ